jgi:hypothetical protein
LGLVTIGVSTILSFFYYFFTLLSFFGWIENFREKILYNITTVDYSISYVARPCQTISLVKLSLSGMDRLAVCWRIKGFIFIFTEKTYTT